MNQTTDTATLIRETRGRLGLTQEKFAAKLGVTLPTINRWENGRTRPSPLAIRNIREVIAAMGDQGRDLVELLDANTPTHQIQVSGHANTVRSIWQ